MPLCRGTTVQGAPRDRVDPASGVQHQGRMTEGRGPDPCSRGTDRPTSKLQSAEGSRAISRGAGVKAGTAREGWTDAEGRDGM